MTDAQKNALKLAADGQPISIRVMASLRDEGLLISTGRASPGYVAVKLTTAGEKAAAQL